MGKRCKAAALCAIILTLFSISVIKAECAGDLKVMRAFCVGEEVRVYAQSNAKGQGDENKPSEGASEGATEAASADAGNEAPKDGVAYQIGNNICENVTVRPASEDENSPRTLIMLDNSLSVPEGDREAIAGIIRGIIGGHSDNEKIRLAVFGDKMSYLSEYSTDYTALQNIVGAITYEDKETYLTDVLMQLMDEFDQEAYQGFTRIVVISDGVDNKPIGYTKEELLERLKTEKYPVYTIGTEKKENSQEIENMFAISRATGADQFLLPLEGEKDPDSIADEISFDGGRLVLVTCPVPADIRDGGTYNSKLTLNGAETEFEIKMPFGEKPEVTNAATEATSADEEPVRKTSRKVGLKDLLFNRMTLIFGGIFLGIVIVTGLVILFFIKGKKEEEPEEEEPDPSQFGKTEFLSDEKSGSTEMLFAGNKSFKKDNVRRIMLIDEARPEKIFQCELEGAIVLGRNQSCDIVVAYEPSISKKHCSVTCKNGKYYVMDMGSSNGTMINGMRIYDEQEIRSGDTLSLGRVSFRVTLN